LRSFIRTRLFIQWLAEAAITIVETDALVGSLGEALSPPDPAEGHEQDNRKNDQQDHEEGSVLFDHCTLDIVSSSAQVGEGAGTTDFASDGDTVDGDSLRSPHAVGVSFALLDSGGGARLSNTLLIDLTNFAHVRFGGAGDVVEGVTDVLDALGVDPGAGGIGQAELRGCVRAGLGSTTRNSTVVPFAVGIGSTDGLHSFGDATDGAALVARPGAEVVDDAIVEVVVAAESVVAASVFTPSASVVTVAAENVGIVVTSGSVDAHVLNDSTAVEVFSGSALSGGESGASSSIDEALGGSNIPEAARSSIANGLVGVGSARRGDALAVGGVPFTALVLCACTSISEGAELGFAADNSNCDNTGISSSSGDVRADRDSGSLGGREFRSPSAVGLQHGVEDRASRDDDGLTFSPEGDEVVQDVAESASTEVEGAGRECRVPAPTGSSARSDTSGTEPS